MGYNLEKQQGGDGKPIKVEATCDGCQTVNFVRKYYALKKLEKADKYFCRSCSSKKNIKKVNTMNRNDNFVDLCETIYLNLMDDLDPLYIAKKINRMGLVDLISQARQFVYDFVWERVDEEVYICAQYIEDNEHEGLINAFGKDVKLKALALLRIETLDEPEGLYC